MEAKNRTLLLKQEDFSRKKEEKPKVEETAKRKDETACLPKPKQSGLSCLRPTTLDEDTEAFTRRSHFLPLDSQFSSILHPPPLWTLTSPISAPALRGGWRVQPSVLAAAASVIFLASRSLILSSTALLRYSVPRCRTS